MCHYCPPLIAVVFALFAAFPMFSEVSVQIRHFIFANFIPATGDVIRDISSSSWPTPAA